MTRDLASGLFLWCYPDGHSWLGYHPVPELMARAKGREGSGGVTTEGDDVLRFSIWTTTPFFFCFFFSPCFIYATPPPTLGPPQLLVLPPPPPLHHVRRGQGQQ